MIPPCAFFVLGLLFCKELGAFRCQLFPHLLSSLVRSILWVAFACRFTVLVSFRRPGKVSRTCKGLLHMGLQDTEEFCVGFRKQVFFISRLFSFLSLLFSFRLWPTLIGPRHKHFLKQVPPFRVSSSAMEFVSFNPACAHMIWR